MATLTDALKLRRSVYKIGKALPVDEEDPALGRRRKWATGN